MVISTCNTGDAEQLGSIPGSGSSPGEGNDYPVQYSCLGNMDRGAWGAGVHGVAESNTKGSGFYSLNLAALLTGWLYSTQYIPDQSPVGDGQ